jgi:hypothetical protein
MKVEIKEVGVIMKYNKEDNQIEKRRNVLIGLSESPNKMKKKI